MLKFPSPEEMWLRHEELILEVFTVSLGMLREESDLPDDENLINEVLALKAREANFQLNQKERGLPFPPAYEKPKQPASRDDLGKSATRTRPDFSCPFRDYAAQNPKDAYLDYHIECKRLGSPPSPSWILNRNYVTNGIVRFLDPEHEYGKGTSSGAMIGYVQSMNLKTILDEINGYLAKVKFDLPHIRFSNNTFGKHGTALTSQEILRLSVLPRDFVLRHLWVDIR